MKTKTFIAAIAAALASSNAFAQSSAADAPVMTETSIIMLHAVRTDCAAQFPALKARLDESFAKLRAQHQVAFSTAEGSTDFDARVDRMRSSIEARKDRARYEAVCAKLAESAQNWR
ncbi:MAG: hypothetical protein RL341_424 [Pseudomonadota bacterium]|jgi:hypothetical protein